MGAIVASVFVSIVAIVGYIYFRNEDKKTLQNVIDSIDAYQECHICRKRHMMNCCNCYRTNGKSNDYI